MTNSEAIETLKANYPDPCFGLLREAVDVAINALSAQPRKGKWVEIQDDIFAPIVVCSNCGQRAMVDLYGEYQRTRYCPNCGADMRGEQDESN